MTKWFFIISAMILLAACQGTETSLSTRQSVAVDPAAQGVQVFRFQSNPASTTTLQFQSNPPGLSFVAEVQDGQGNIVAILDSDILETATLTIAPGTAQYQVLVATKNPGVAGKVSLSLSQPTNDLPITDTTSARGQTLRGRVSYTAPSSDCHLVVSSDGGVNLRAQPDTTTTIFSVVPVNSQHRVDARTQTGWYQISYNGQSGWVLGDVVRLNGVCNNIPVQTLASPTSVPNGTGGVVIPGVTAPFDVDVHYFGIDRNGGGQFQDAVSFPNGDSRDRIHVSVADLQIADPRTFALILNCEGSGAEELRWGLPNNPLLTCFDSLPMPFTSTINNLEILVMLPGGVGQRYVNYRLQAVPIAPADDKELPVGIDRDHGGQVSQTISYPAGDQTDNIALVMTNLEQQSPNNYRQFHLTLLCEGTGIEFVRWGGAENPSLVCGQAMPGTFTVDAAIQWIQVTVPDGSGQSYVNYTLVAMPAAPVDNETYLFGLDRDMGGQFNEVISHPNGDTLDTVQLTITNLTEQIPNNFRELNMTLVCNGKGLEHIRWGNPANPNLTCGASIPISFLYSMNQQPLIVMLPDAAPQSYVSYTLMVSPIVPPTLATPKERLS